MDSEPESIVATFIDAVVNEQNRALEQLAAHPSLIGERWVHGESLIHFLAVEGFVDGVRFLAENGADVNATNKFGDSPLLDAVVLGSHDVVGVLLQFGANPDAMSDTRDNALHVATAAGDVKLVEILLEAGANPSYVTDLDETIFDVLSPDDEIREKTIRLLARYGSHPKSD